MEHEVDVRLRAALAAPVAAGPGRTLPAGRDTLLAIFTAQVQSRAADLATRELRARGMGYYSIASAGHEANAAVAAALRPTDPALLHYRSGAFYAMRAAQIGVDEPGGIDPVRDILLGVVGAAEDPISGGRHKVFGRSELAIIPQTSTIASHLPRAVGLAFALGRAAKLAVKTAFPVDALVVCSFGDASINHSTALGALNSARQLAYRGLPVPLLFVCEDNGLGISVPTPSGWVERAFGGLPDLEYRHVTSTDTWDAVAAAMDLAEVVRRRRRPALLHLDTVRFLGHAGTDVESGYRRPEELSAELARDPLLAHARALIGAGVCTAAEILRRYDDALAHARAVAAAVSSLPQLSNPAAIMAPLTRAAPAAAAEAAARMASPENASAPVTLAAAINTALRQILLCVPGALVFGEDVARKGGVYGVTRGLQKEFGPARVFDTLLDEQTILGLALGTGLAGLLPIAEIQYLAYLHNAEDQLRGEAATQAFFSDGRYTNPMVVRIAGYGYQKGFGGHFHNDDSVAVLRDIPGIVIASPARPDDAAAMLRTCAAVASAEGRVCVFLEPIALYHTRDLFAEGDGGWLAHTATDHVPVGRARTYGDGTDLTILTFGNGLWMSLRVAKVLAGRGIQVRVVDLRWLAPLPMDDVLHESLSTGTVLVVDETRRTGGVSEGVVTGLVDRGFTGRIARVASKDSFVPLGGSANLVLVSEDDILTAALELLARSA